ncbi:DUF1540 domain-containing protein [Bacillus testis]|uniref:DUF1540 domain-containing protein n=1 Tax=Bacillus testis TaxID=1622072 RepID=UPI0009461482|nr:DUF1540 domain-containing protein [Bacillus testis]
MAKDVKCGVNTCFYWKHGNHCGAKNILVEVYSPDERAHSSSHTGCHTFRPKEEF